MRNDTVFLYNFSSNLFLQIIVLFSGFLIPKAMIYYYGSEINGLIVSLMQFFSYFSLVEAGIASTSIVALYKPLAMRDIKCINGIVSATQRLYWKSGSFFSLLTIGLAVVFSNIVIVSVLDKWEVFILTVALGFGTSLDFFVLSKYRVILTADQKIYIVSFINSIATIIQTVIIFEGAQLGFDVVVVRVVAIFSVFVKTLFLYIVTKNKYYYLNLKTKPLYGKIEQKSDALLLQVCGVIQNTVPIIIVGFFLDLKNVSVYSIYNLIILGVQAFLTVLINSIYPIWGNLSATNKLDVLKENYQRFESCYFYLSAIIYGTLFVTITPFVEIYTFGVNDMNYNFPQLGWLLCISGFTYALKCPQIGMITALGLFRETIIPVGGIILYFQLGILGVVWSIIISNVYRTIAVSLFLSKRQFFSIHTIIKKFILTSISAGLAVCIGNIFIVNTDSIIGVIFITAIILFITLFLLLVLIRIVDKSLYEFVKNILLSIRRKL